jgi:hypothetical protein
MQINLSRTLFTRTASDRTNKRHCILFSNHIIKKLRRIMQSLFVLGDASGICFRPELRDEGVAIAIDATGTLRRKL